MRFAKVTKYAAIGIVAGIAAYASYSHMRDLALDHGQKSSIAALLPLSVDGMLVVATIAMKEDRGNGLKVRAWAWIAFVLGVAASVVANVLAAEHDVTSRVISAWPAVALLLVIEVLATGKKAGAKADGLAAGPGALLVPAVAAPAPEPVPVVFPDLAVIPEPVFEPEPVKVAASRKPVNRIAPTTTTGELVAKVAAANPELTSTQVAERLGIAPRTARRYMPSMAAGKRSDNDPGATSELRELASV